MSRELKYRIFGDNMLGRATGGAIAALGRLRDFGVRTFRRLTLAAAGAAAGIAYFGVKAVGNWLDKTRSLGEVRRALQATGQASKENQKYLRDLTDWLQTTANVSDDAGDAAVAYALRLGVAAGEMGDFMKMALTLSKVMGGDLTTAIRYLTRAENEGTQMLRRYGIEVDQTMSKEQQYAALKQRMMQMYDRGLTGIDDTGSKLQNLRLRIADVVKEMGRNITEGLKLDQVFDFLRNKAQSLIEALQKQDNPFSRWIQDVRRVAVEVAAIGQALADSDRRQETIAAIGNLIGAAIMDAAQGAANILIKAAPEIGRLIGQFAKSMVDGLVPQRHREVAGRIRTAARWGTPLAAASTVQWARDRMTGRKQQESTPGVLDQEANESETRQQTALRILREAVKGDADAIEQALANVKVEIPDMPTAPGGGTGMAIDDPASATSRRNISLGEVFDVLHGGRGQSTEERHMMESLRISRDQAETLKRIEKNTHDSQGGMTA